MLRCMYFNLYCLFKLSQDRVSTSKLYLDRFFFLHKYFIICTYDIVRISTYNFVAFKEE